MSIVVFTFAAFDRKHPFCANLVQNCLFVLKFGTETNSSVLNAVVMFKFTVFDKKLLYWKILSKIFKLPGEAEMWYPEKFEYVELNGCTGDTLFGLQKQNCLSNLKFGT